MTSPHDRFLHSHPT
jgi:hypothetical protein